MTALVARARSGFLHAPSAALEVPLPSYASPSSPSATYDDQHTTSFDENDPQNKAISYSVSQTDYDYLRQYKNGGHRDRSVNGDAPYHHTHNDYFSNSLVNSNAARYDASNYQNNLVSVQQSSEFLNGGAQSHSHISNIGLAAVPLVTKHIYFHVPPPDVEEVSVRAAPVQPPKKTYNIMFIKVPSQKPRPLVVLQASQQAEKTLIYVLVKKPDPPVLLPPPSPPASVSEHEVLFVKYRGEPHAQGLDEGAAAGTELLY